MNKDQLENHLVRNCKTWASTDGIRDFHRFSFPIHNSSADTKYSRDHYHSSDHTKCYYWHTRFANGQGASFNYIVKKILNDSNKGIINLINVVDYNKEKRV
tara:strand:+ start:192 stop:494 length:303 start_codon:yes stop_codon:yes gene_type:complete